MSPESELQTIIEGIGEGFYAVDRDWRIRLYNSEAERHFGRPAEEMIGRVLWDIFPAARDTMLGRIFLQVMDSRQPVRAETPSVVIPDRWLAYRLFPVGDGIGVVFRDISDRRQAEQQRDLLMAELNHRVKNSLAIVQAIAAQTLREVDPVIRATFAARLLALSVAQNVLTEKNWASADFHEIVRSSTAPHRPQDDRRLVVEGPHLRLNPQSAVAFALAIHELCTNALKYGAFSTDQGRVEIGWSVDQDRLTFRWQERNGPPMRSPDRKGFGSRMIEVSLPAQIRGRARIDHATDGLQCTIEAPLTAICEGSAH